MGLIEPIASFVLGTPMLFSLFEVLRKWYPVIVFFHLVLVIGLLVYCFPKIKVTRREWMIIGAILVLGIMLRLVFAHPDINGEGYTHLAQGVCVSLDEKRFDPFCDFRNFGGDHPLGWPIMLGVLWSIIPSSTMSAVLFTMAISVFSLIVMYYVTRLLFKKRNIALLSMFLLATFPLYTYFSAHTGTEVMNELALLIAFGAFALLRRKQDILRYTFFFLALGYAVQVRVDNWMVLGIFSLFVAFTYRKSWKNMIPGIILTGCLLLPAFYTTLTYQKHILSSGVLLQNGAGYLSVLAQLLLPLLPLIILAVAGYIIKEGKTDIQTITILLVSYVGVQLIFILATHARPLTYMYLHTITAVLIVLAVGMESILIWMKSHIGKSAAFYVLSVLVLITFFIPYSHYSSIYIRAPTHYDLEVAGFPRFSTFLSNSNDPYLETIDPTGEMTIVLVHHAVSAEKLLINTDNPFIDFRMIESWQPLVKEKLFLKNKEAILAAEPSVFLVMDIEKEPYLFSLFEESFTLLYHKRVGQYSVYFVTS